MARLLSPLSLQHVTPSALLSASKRRSPPTKAHHLKGLLLANSAPRCTPGLALWYDFLGHTIVQTCLLIAIVLTQLHIAATPSTAIVRGYVNEAGAATETYDRTYA